MEGRRGDGHGAGIKRGIFLRPMGISDITNFGQGLEAYGKATETIITSLCSVMVKRKSIGIIENFLPVVIEYRQDHQG